MKQVWGGSPQRGPGAAPLGFFCFSLLTFGLLIWLGIWQLHRLAWKEAILADIDRAERSAPIALPEAGVSRFTKIRVSGVLRGGPVALYGADVRDVGGVPRMGAQLLEVLDREGAGPVLVDLGWVPSEGGRAAVQGRVDLVGFVRPSEQAGWLSAEDDLARRHFYTLDAGRIGAALGVAGLAPFTLVALGPAAGGGPVPADALPRPANNHLNYALTWFGLAAALAGVFGAWAWRAFSCRTTT